MPNWNLTAAHIRTTNTVRLTFDLDMKQTNTADLDDALNPENYAISIFIGAGSESGAGVGVGDGRSRFGSQIDQLSPVDLKKVDLRFWPSLDDNGATYQVSAGTDIKGASGEARGIIFSQNFNGLQVFTIQETPEQKALGQDFANDAFTGKYKLTDEGVYARHKAIPYLKKRIFRRIITTAGGFSHLPKYGEGLPLKIKRIIKPSEIRSFKNSLRQGILKDTDVSDVAIALEQQDTGIMKIYLQVKTNFGMEFEQTENFQIE